MGGSKEEKKFKDLTQPEQSHENDLVAGMTLLAQVIRQYDIIEWKIQSPIRQAPNNEQEYVITCYSKKLRNRNGGYTHTDGKFLLEAVQRLKTQLFYITQILKEGSDESTT